MKARTRLAYLLVVTVLVFAVFTVPVLAQEDEPAPTTPSEELEPAVEVTIPAEEEAQLDWTYRFMIPTAIALGVVVIVVTSAQYFTQVVRKRYRIVEE